MVDTVKKKKRGISLTFYREDIGSQDTYGSSTIDRIWVQFESFRKSHIDREGPITNDYQFV